MAKELVKKYGKENVNAVSCNTLSTLLKSVQDKLINFLFLDDYTLTKTTKQELASYFKIRHVIESRTGRNTGIVLTILGLHRFYGCDPSVRTNFDFLFFRSAPTNRFDNNWTKGYIGKDGCLALSALEMDRNKDAQLYNTTLAWVKGAGSGFINTPLPDKIYMHLRPRKKTKEELYESFKRTAELCNY